MECSYCKGKMAKGKTSYTINRRGYHLVIDQVPAYLCTQCGEPYFEEEGVKVIQEMLKVIDKKSEELQAVA
ncbi:MAG: type II toxin-antitoxin system MqsA family antitoxin [Deltaproteobacteria bacterium]|nr:type II toxin-antitoxin system MqsA family antitoxin [Deltaproteobacteria bacterium]